MRGGRSNFDRGFDQRRDNFRGNEFRGNEFRGDNRRDEGRFGGREMVRNNMQRNYPPNRNMKRNNRYECFNFVSTCCLGFNYLCTSFNEITKCLAA